MNPCSSRKSNFGMNVKKILQENVGLAMDDRRHSQINNASAISVRDLQQQVSARCPPSTAIPSLSWLSFQFWPKSAHAHSKIHVAIRGTKHTSSERTTKTPILQLVYYFSIFFL